MKRAVQDTGPSAALLAALACLGGGEGDARPLEVTFSEHVAPIVYRSCLPCHRAGESAPFQLLEYEEVAKRARQIAEVTRDRYMPPWLPSPGHGEFLGDRRLSDEEIATIARWVEAGSPLGDPARLPPGPPAAAGWQLGEPDLVLTMPEPFVLAEEGLDVFRNIVLPIPVDRARFVEAIELRPGNKRVVHHAVMRIDRTSWSRDLDAQDAEPGFGGMDLGLSESPGGHFLGWAPGRVPFREPEGMAWTLQPGSDLIVQLHMVPRGKPEPIQISVGLFFTEHPPTEQLMLLLLRNDDIDIPAGESDYVVEDTLTLPVNVVLSKISPHAHYLGKRMEGTAELPDGTRRDLVLIEDWDFNWQDVYQYESPMLLPSGTRLSMRYTFDNSAENPRNPQVPPQRVRIGNRSSDEMATLGLQLALESGKDRRALMEASWRHRVECIPGHWMPRLNFGAILAEQGKYQEAATELRAGLAMKPDSVDILTNLGAVLIRTNELRESREHLEEALRLRPGHPDAHFVFANLEKTRGRWGDAAAHYRAVLETSPRDTRALRGLGSSLVQLDRLGDAVASFEKALELDPTDYESYYELGRIAVRQDRLEDATKAFAAGLEIHPLPEAHADLARVYRARGMPAEAERHAEEARRLSTRSPR
jgi:tetratricopeptide (TPR) repeat protein